MPITQAHYSVGTTRVRIVAPDIMPQHVCIHNHEHSSSRDVFIGDGTVTIANGFHLLHTDRLQITIGPGDSLFAIADSGTNELHVMIVKQD